MYSLRNLCGLTYTLYTTLDQDSAVADSRQGLIDKFCAVVPAVIVARVDSEENMESNMGNGILNVARHSCEYLEYAATHMYECTLERKHTALA
jgi:hypothetical protein